MDYLASTQHTVAWFKKAAEDGTLDIAPPFQRNPVWLDPQKAFLIDSILRGYPIPELYIQDSVNEAGVERHIVVDGQQRIRACLEFAEGGFSLDPAQSPDFGEVTFDQLSPEAKTRFFGYKFVARVLPETPPELLRELFARLNRNVVALNSQELRHATYWGPFITLMEKLATLEFWPTSGVFTVNDFRRMLDVEFIGELAVALLHGPQNKKESLEDWFAAYEQDFDAAPEVERTFGTVISELSQLLPDISRTRWSKKSDFYTLFTGLAPWVGSMPLARDERAALEARLDDFGSKVDSILKLDPGDEETLARQDALARRYAQAVARAASDLNNRRVRLAAMKELLVEVLGPEPGKAPPGAGVAAPVAAAEAGTAMEESEIPSADS